MKKIVGLCFGLFSANASIMACEHDNAVIDKMANSSRYAHRALYRAILENPSEKCDQTLSGRILMPSIDSERIGDSGLEFQFNAQNSSPINFDIQVNLANFAAGDKIVLMDFRMGELKFYRFASLDGQQQDKIKTNISSKTLIIKLKHELRLPLEQNEPYIAYGSNLLVWIENAEGQRVSPIEELELTGKITK